MSDLASRASSWLVVACCALISIAAANEDPQPPPVTLAEVYHLGDPLDLSAYRVSEKYDGVRAWWTGRELLTRSGRRIHAPAWFTAGWPQQVLDGELWGGRGRFETTSGTVRKSVPVDEEWRLLRYRVFDLPEHPGNFDQRQNALTALIPMLGPWIEGVKQETLKTAQQLETRLKSVVSAGGEGLMLRRGDSHHHAGRSRDLLKLKLYDDAEAVVIGYLPGRGKYEGMTGALLVERADGLRFAIGSGLSDEQRRHPPGVGSSITYAYTGLTEAGVPRFARLLRPYSAP